MNHRWKKLAVSCLMALALVTILGPGCGKGEEEGNVIVIGHLSDMTGPSSPALLNVNYALEDLVRHVNEQDIIPGVELKMITYDTRYDPARAIPGYDWCRGKGAQVIVCGLPPIVETLRTFADRDEFPIFSLPCSEILIEPPGWVFCMNAPTSSMLKTLLKWISENDWDYQAQGRKTRIGSAVWDDPFGKDCTRGIKEYVQDHPAEFEYVAGLQAPTGVMLWSGEVEMLKDCDYLFVPPTGIGTTGFIIQFRDKGYTAKFLGNDSQPAFRGLIVDKCGWDYVDGMLNSYSVLWWNEPVPLVELARELLHKYHPAQFDDIVHEGGGYIGSFHEIYCCLQIIQKAVEQVGPENFSAQALYDATIGFETAWEGYEAWGFTQTKRYAVDYLAIYEWSAQEQDLVRKVSDWVPVVTE